jgi:hypothetical protein
LGNQPVEGSTPLRRACTRARQTLGAVAPLPVCTPVYVGGHGFLPPPAPCLPQTQFLLFNEPLLLTAMGSCHRSPFSSLKRSFVALYKPLPPTATGSWPRSPFPPQKTQWAIFPFQGHGLLTNSTFLPLKFQFRSLRYTLHTAPAHVGKSPRVLANQLLSTIPRSLP